jgi:hypothetical protein
MDRSYRVALSQGVLDGFAGDLVHQRERRVPFLVLDASAVPHVLHPVLHQPTNQRNMITFYSVHFRLVYITNFFNSKLL